MAKDEKIQYPMRGKIIILLFIFIFFVPYAEGEQIRTEKGLFLIETHIEKGNLKVGENKPIELILRDASGNSIEGADIKATPWMREHEHGLKTSVHEVGKGLYIIKNFYFTMKGRWDLIVEIKHRGMEDSAVIPLPKVK